MRVVSAVFVVIGLVPVNAHGACPTAKVYTLDADFDQDFAAAEFRRVNHAAPNSDRLQLDPPPNLYPYINIACLGSGTIVRIFVGTADDNAGNNFTETTPPFVVGEYWTGPAGGSRTPSRTAVDHRGNLWVGARTNNAVTRIALLIGGTRCDASGVASPTGQYLKPPFDYCSVGPPPNGD